MDVAWDGAAPPRRHMDGGGRQAACNGLPTGTYLPTACCAPTNPVVTLLSSYDSTLHALCACPSRLLCHVPQDTMESFFLSETVKYLYLLFSNASAVVDHFVLSTEVRICCGSAACLLGPLMYRRWWITLCCRLRCAFAAAWLHASWVPSCIGGRAPLCAVH